MKLKSIPHNTFKRNRDTLSMKLAIPLRAALLGFEVQHHMAPRTGKGNARR